MVTLDNIIYKKNKTIIINNLSLTCPENKITFIIGPNGSGKSTILEMIDLLINMNYGSITINDNIIDKNIKEKEKISLRKYIGLVFQNPDNVFLTNTVKDELEFSMNIFKYNQESREKRITDALKIVNLDQSKLNINPLSLNRSDKEKLAIACVLIGNPKIILLDEPTIGLDDKAKTELIKLIRMLKNKYNKTFIIASHDMDFVLKLADKINVIDNGKLVMSGTKYDIFKDEENLKKYNLLQPPIIDFINQANKVTKLKYRDDINDLIKDIYRSVR